MRQFIVRSILFFVAIIAIFAVMTVTMRKDENNYLCMLDKKDSLLMSTPSPRYIFVSGSSLAFGLDSRMVRDSLHTNVVNAALHAGLGLKYILHGVTPFLHDRDTVVISMEYEQLCNQMYGDAVTLSPAMYYTNFRGIETMNLQQLLFVLSGYPTALRMNRKSLKDSEKNVTYVVKSFNEFGDEEAHRTNPPAAQNFYPPLHKKRVQPDTYGACLLQCLEEMKAKGAVVIIIPSPMRRGAYDEQVGKEVTAFLRDNGYPLLVPYEEHLFPDSLMYDTDYHLSGKGVEIFTKKLIKELKQRRKCSAS